VNAHNTSPTCFPSVAAVGDAWFTPWDINRPASGAPLRSYHLVRGVAPTLGMTVFSPLEDVRAFSSYPALIPSVDLRQYERGGFGRFRSHAIFNPAARAARGPALDALCRQLGLVWSHGDEHWIVCDSAYITVPLRRLVRSTGARLIYSSHNCEADVWRQLFETAPSVRARVEALLAHWEIRRQERSLLRVAAAIWCCSAQDARRFAGMVASSADRCIVVPNGVNPEVVPLQKVEPIEPDTIVFIGYLGTSQIHEACVFLINNLLPRLRALSPGARLLLAGRDPRPELKALAADGVEIVSPLADPAAVLRRARLSVVPVFQGGGTRIKILESLAAGRPVVSTTKGAEGLDLKALQGVTIADSEVDMAMAVLEELRRPLPEDRAHELRRHVLALYDWDRIVRHLHQAMATRFAGPWRS
jgi:glycosyltransferase involved in cell wall biosynthesis